jgi:hypothetical protein
LNGFRVLPYDVVYPSTEFKRVYKKQKRWSDVWWNKNTW